jgi:hypothetical protein
VSDDPCGELDAVGEPEFGQDVFEVAVGGARGDAQPDGDVSSGRSLAGECDDLAFADGQGGRWLSVRAGLCCQFAGLVEGVVDGLVGGEAGAVLEGRGELLVPERGAGLVFAVVVEGSKVTRAGRERPGGAPDRAGRAEQSGGAGVPAVGSCDPGQRLQVVRNSPPCGAR